MKTVMIATIILTTMYLGILLGLDVCIDLEENGWEITSVHNSWSDNTPN